MTDGDRSDPLDAELAALAPLLDRLAAPAPSRALVERTLLLARAELRRSPAIAPGVATANAGLPTGFRRELARLVAFTLPALVLVLAWAALLLRAAPEWLASWLPAELAFALVAAHVIGALGWIGLTYASLPLVAHRRTLLRLRSSEA